MATGDGAEVRIALPPVGDTGAGRQGETGPAQTVRKGTLWFDVPSRMVGFCEWGPVDRGGVPIRLRDRTYVVGLEGSMPHFTTGIQFRPEVGEEQPGW